MIATLDPRRPDEPQHEYAARALQYAVAYGLVGLPASDLEQIDAAALRTVAALPATLDPDAQRFDQVLHTLRLRIARALETHRQARKAAQQAIDALYAPPGDADGLEAQTPGQPEPTPQERAVRLLRAALTLVLTPPDDRNGPGSPARLVPPTPRIPPSGQANPIPRSSAPAPTVTRSPADGIPF